MRILWREITITSKKLETTAKKSYLWSSKLADLYNWGLIVSQDIFYDLYKSNWDIRQSVRKISNSVSRNGIYLQDNDRQTIEDNKITDEVLDYFKTPTFLKFKTDIFRNYLISGELYIVPKINLNADVIGFQVLDSRSITKRTDKYGNIYEFVATSNNWEQKIYKTNQILFTKLEDDVNNSNNGMGLLHGVVYDALSDLEASKTNYALYQNSAIPSAMLLLDWDLTASEQQLAKEQFDSQFRGSANQHKTLIAGGIKDIKTLSITPRDMEFINQRHLTTEKVSAVFGVPKLILGYVDNVNYSNGRELKKEFLDGTIVPYEWDLEDILNRLLQMFLPDLRKKYRIKCDSEQLDETQERYEGQRKDVDRGILTINEVRIDRGLEPSQEPNCNKHITSRNSVLLEDISLDAVLDPNEI